VSDSSDSGAPPPEGRSGPPLRIGATDLAILAALSRPYMAGQRFVSPTPNNRILEELASNGIYIDLDTLRSHLRGLYARFGVEEELTPAEKRVRLIELVHHNHLIAGWETSDSSIGAQTAPIAQPAAVTAPASSTDTPQTPPPVPTAAATEHSRSLAKLKAPLLAHGRARAAAGLATALIALALVSVFFASSGADGGDRRDAVRVIDPAAMNGATGTVTYCTGKDVVTSTDGETRQHQKAVRDFNAKFGPALHADLKQFPEEASQQYEQFSRLQRRRSGDCDVFYSDITWTADFAHNRWLYDLSPYAERRLKSFVPAMREAAVFDGRIWGVPKQADAALLFYNKATVSTAPTTWQELYAQAAKPPAKQLRYQGLDYEGLTVNFLEIAYAAGVHEIVTPQHNANIDQTKALVALQFMAQGIRDHAAPREVINQSEEASLRAFGNGRAAFMRNWPYAYAALSDPKTYPDVARKVGVAPLPAWKNGVSTSVLGGHILVIPASSDNPGAALKLVDYLSSQEIIKQDATTFALVPALVDLWDDPEVQRALPAFADLKSAVFSARSRPVTPGYAEISAAISKNVNRALRGQPPEEALATANDDIQQVLDRVYGRTP